MLFDTKYRSQKKEKDFVLNHDKLTFFNIVWLHVFGCFSYPEPITDGLDLEVGVILALICLEHLR